MSIEYSGTVVTNEAYKVKKLQQHIKQLEVQVQIGLDVFTQLELENERLKDVITKLKEDKPKPVTLKPKRKRGPNKAKPV